jgi:uncharacterized protein YlzI (FlbEa/FlbD family)
MKWITLKPYDRGSHPPHEDETEWIWVNADKIEMLAEGSKYKSVTPPTTLVVGGREVRVKESPSEILGKIEVVQ